VLVSGVFEDAWMTATGAKSGLRQADRAPPQMQSQGARMICTMDDQGRWSANRSENFYEIWNPA
jgi:hypothetical protein